MGLGQALEDLLSDEVGQVVFTAVGLLVCFLQVDQLVYLGPVPEMLDQGHDLLYYENIEGGHSGAADNTQRAYMKSLEMAFMWTMLR